MDARKTKIETQIQELKKLRTKTGLNRKQFADFFGIPLRTMEDWEAGKRKMPDYLLHLMTYKIQTEYLYTKYRHEKYNKSGEITCENKRKRRIC